MVHDQESNMAMTTDYVGVAATVGDVISAAGCAADGTGRIELTALAAEETTDEACAVPEEMADDACAAPEEIADEACDATDETADDPLLSADDAADDPPLSAEETIDVTDEAIDVAVAVEERELR